MSSSKSFSVGDAFAYDLPADRIAQRPVEPRDAAKMLVIDRKHERLSEDVFSELASYLQHGDLLVFNDTRVLPARLFGKRSNTGGEVELLLAEQVSDRVWDCLARPRRKLKQGQEIDFSGGLKAQVLDASDDLLLRVEFLGETSPESVGVMPIPPYIRKGKADSQDIEDYQTVFAKNSGSIAAPTASLHFTTQLLDKARTKDVDIHYLTLHVGSASFLPVAVDDELQAPGFEKLVFSSDTVEVVARAKSRGGRVIAVGTTVVRALETILARTDTPDGELIETDLFITPGYQFRGVDCLITNFHQPGTTHLLLVQALLGRDLLEKSYGYALANEFRMLSYGDGMFIA